MRIRYKLIVLLLVIALAPLSVATYIAQKQAMRMAEDLAQTTRETLTENAKRVLVQSVRDQASTLRCAGQIIEHNVRIQARDASRCLNQEIDGEAVFHWASEFESMGNLSSLRQSQRYLRLLDDGRTQEIPISFEHASFQIAPGVVEADVLDDIARLMCLTPTYRLVQQSQADVIHWQYIALHSGVHMSFPGHGFFPEEYDARKRIWYELAIQKDELTWSPPIIDASTSQVMFTVSMPVRGLHGKVVGVTGIDVKIDDVIDQVELPSEWADSAETIIATRIEDPLTGEKRLVEMATRNFDSSAGWDALLVPPEVQSGDAEQLTAFEEDIAQSKSGFRMMPYEGRMSMWSYAPVAQTDVGLVAIIPYDRVIQPARGLEQRVRDRIERQRYIVIGLMIGVLVTVVLLSLLSAKHVTSPIQELVDATHRIADGDLETETPVRTSDEVGELARTVNMMLPKLRDRMRIKGSLAVAMEVQQALLPDEPPVVEGLDIAGTSVYCDETGGDYYDFVDLSSLNPHTVGVAVGDVTGHGIAAALLMATARAHLRSRADQPGSLGELLNHMNRHLAMDAPNGRFMTLCFMLFGGEQLTVRWANAGHDPAILYRAALDEFEELVGGGVPLGVDADWRYDEFGPKSLHSNDVLVLGTDGVWETRNASRELFGKDRLKETIHRNKLKTAAEIAEAITTAAKEFRGEHQQDDDLTLVVVKAC